MFAGASNPALFSDVLHANAKVTAAINVEQTNQITLYQGLMVNLLMSILI